ncbi:hypothetical protein L3X38_022673 [Prunus dulcis]|uniref:Zinc transporter 1 n=1 Tax=Prunus dulcis TaxID=3755 RepID=A0AAD4Z4T4_PRUDU|nr:hypothetical protein L3X38_022673 [Prunus dulcis]
MPQRKPMGKFPFTGFVAMLSAIGTLMTGDHVHGRAADHVHATQGHHGHGSEELRSSELIRHRVISQVLELGILVHSVIVGISLGASQSPETIKPLMVALSFHQFFQGMGLGGCISQAKFKPRSAVIRATPPICL